MQTILLIDSCALTRECLSTILRAKGYRVQCTSQIAQARAMIAKRPPDLLITEIRLPDGNALNLMRKLKDDPNASKIKICLLTQAAAKKPIMEAIELGACKVMLKSKFTVSGFIEQIASIFSAGTAQSNAGDATSDQPADVCYSLPEPAKDPALALKEIKPIIARSQLNERLEELGDLCTLSEPISKLLEAIDTPETSIEHVAELLKMDQTIAMKVMKIVNSSTYARGEQTTMLKDAVLRLGLENLRELVAEIGIIDQLADQPDTGGALDPAQLWTHALGVGVCSSKIAGLCANTNPEIAFTAAVLHDIGRVILQQMLPELYPKVLDVAHSLGVPLELAEKRMLLSDHSTISQNMLNAWNLPKDLVDAIANHHCPPNKLATQCPKNTSLAATIALGNRMIHAMGIGSSGNRTISSTEELFDLLDNPELNVSSLAKGLEKQICEMRSLIFPTTGENEPLAVRDHSESPAFDRAFHPLYITMEPKHDAIGYWVVRHADEQTDPVGPNIAIVHLRQARDRQALAEKLEAALAARPSGVGSGPLPILMLSPTGKISLPDELLSKHPAMHLMTPFSVLHFERAANHLLNGMIRPMDGKIPRRAA